jgi:hypothetical protein
VTEAINNLAMTPVPALEMLGREAARGSVTGAARPWLRKAELTQQALAIRAYLLEGRHEQLDQVPLASRSNAQMVRMLAIECVSSLSAVSVDQLYEVAMALLPFLSREELRRVWDKLKVSPCAARLGESQRTWLALFAAVSERDAGNMVRLAESLLKQDAARKDYLLGAAVTGHLALDEHEKAVALWQEFAGKVTSPPNDVLPELLRGHLFSRQPAGTSRQTGNAAK